MILRRALLSHHERIRYKQCKFRKSENKSNQKKNSRKTHQKLDLQLLSPKGNLRIFEAYMQVSVLRKFLMYTF